MTTRCFENALNILTNVRNAVNHGIAQDVSKLSISIGSTFLLLIIPHDQLDKLSRVDVRIARILYVLNDLQWEMGRQSPCSLAKGL